MGAFVEPGPDVVKPAEVPIAVAIAILAAASQESA
jgi:hypothetical protein